MYLTKYINKKPNTASAATEPGYYCERQWKVFI